MAIMLKNVRLSFPSLFQTELYNGDDTGKYTSTFLLDKEAHADTIAEIKKGMKEAAEAKFGKPIPKAIKYALRDGDEVDTDGYAGCYSLKAGTKKRPLTIDKSTTVVAEEDDVFYAGCYVNAKIDYWVQDNQWGKRVNCNLLAVQFIKDGEAFGTGDNKTHLSDFEVVEDDGDEVDPF